MKSILLFFFLFIQCTFMSAQTITVNTAEVCAAQEVFLPVTAESLLNIGALTLFIGFDTTKLTYVSVENIDPQLAGMSANLMTDPSQLAFAWSSISSISFVNGKMFDLKFISNGSTTPVLYNPGCELSDPSGLVIPVNFNNGGVFSGLPEISTQPKDTSIIEGGHAVFSVASPNSISFYWKESHDQGISWQTLEDGGIYSGTHSPALSISPVPLSYNKNQYQCVLNSENCFASSTAATLSVEQLTSTLEISKQNKIVLKISPVPCHDQIDLEFLLHENGVVMIQALNYVGQIVTETDLPSQTKGRHHIELSTTDWRPGVYFIKFTLIFNDRELSEIVKLIKN